MKKSLIIVVFTTLMIATLGQVTAQTPAVTLSEITINPDDTVYVYGTDFDTNTTVRIDLYLPTGIIIEGVAYTTTDQNGSFNTSFKAPDTPEGSGYVKAISGNLTVSKYVYFKGSVLYNLEVTIPDNVYVNEYTNITVNAPFLTGNHIIDITLTQPDSSILNLYYVLHDGYSNIPIKFAWEGTYHLFLSVEDTPYNYTADITVQKNTQAGNTNQQSQQNTENTTTESVKFSVSNNLNIYRISVTSGNETVLSGEIYLYRPDGKSETLKIEHGIATFIADKTGSYEVQFIKDKRLYTKTISFNPTVKLKTDVGSTGIMSMDFTVDGSETTANAVIYRGESKLTTVLLVNGIGTYTLPKSGSYTIKASIYNKTAISTIDYQEEPTIENIYATVDHDTLWITGTVIGRYSGSPIEDKTISIQVSGIGTIYARTDNSGKFMETTTIPSDRLGQTIYISASVGNYQKTLSVKTEKDFWGAYGIYIFLIAILLLGIAYKKGYFDWIKKPPAGRTKKAISGKRFKVGG